MHRFIGARKGGWAGIGQAPWRRLKPRHATPSRARRSGWASGRSRRATAFLGPGSRSQGPSPVRVAGGAAGFATDGGRFAGVDAAGEARHRHDAFHVQVGNRRAGGGGGGLGARHADATLAGRGARRRHLPLWPGAHRHVAADAGARGDVRHGCHACGAQAGVGSLRAHASPVAALPPGAQDRRAHARARAGSARHREHHAHDADDLRADHRRVRAGGGRAGGRVRLALRAGRDGDDRALSGLHGARHRLAHRHPPHHERERQRRQHQGDRQPLELRDGEVFRRRGARGAPLRPVDGGLRESEREELHLACRAQRRPGRDLHRRAHGRAW